MESRDTHHTTGTSARPERPIPIWAPMGFGRADASARPDVLLTPYWPSHGRLAGAVVVCPGGGYAVRAAHEGEPVARWLTTLGIAAFVLDYRVAPDRHPAPLDDARRALRLVRHFAGEWSIRADRIGIMGFSAGGHLAATVATHVDAGNPGDDDPIERRDSRPDAVVLGYPVVSFGDIAHAGSMRNLLGDEPTFALRQHLSADLHVSDRTPPMFLWHTADDHGVPVEHSLRLAAALGRHGVPFALHVFPHGAHGLGLGNDDPVVGQWAALCAGWLSDLGFTGEV